MYLSSEGKYICNNVENCISYKVGVCQECKSGYLLLSNNSCIDEIDC